MKSDLIGAGRVALPLAFTRDPSGNWYASWMHLSLRGRANFNRVETHGISASTLARAIIQREYLTIRYLTDLMARPTEPASGPGMFIGIEKPHDLPDDVTAYTLANLTQLLAIPRPDQQPTANTYHQR